MTLKQKALLQTLGLLTSAFGAAIVVAIGINFLSLSTILYTIGFAFVTYMFYLVYKINLSQLEYREKLKEMVDQKSF